MGTKRGCVDVTGRDTRVRREVDDFEGLEGGDFAFASVQGRNLVYRKHHNRRFRTYDVHTMHIYRYRIHTDHAQGFPRYFPT